MKNIILILMVGTALFAPKAYASTNEQWVKRCETRFNDMEKLDDENAKNIPNWDRAQSHESNSKRFDACIKNAEN